MAVLGLRVYQKNDTNSEFSVLLENKKAKTSLLFQSGTVALLSQPETDVIRGDGYSRILDSYGCLGVLQMCPGENTQLYLVVVTRCIKICNFLNSSIYKVQDADIISLQSMRPQNYKSQEHDESWMREMKKLLGNESFYFSANYGSGTSTDDPIDLTLCAQRRVKTGRTDNRFFWNRLLHLHPKRFGIDCNRWLLKLICGSIEFSSIYMNNHSPKLLIISRLSCERAGTRFMVRGVNDGGHVANFVETEQLIHVDTLDDSLFSYVQIRGSVPLFWEQPGLNVGSHKVRMSREPEVSLQAFQKHMQSLRERYGRMVVLNVLGTGVTGRSQGEAALSHIFQIQHSNCSWSKDCPHIVFDFHQECRGGNVDNLTKRLRPQISEAIETFAYFSYKTGQVHSMQRGIMRTNCVDCLDRTNRVQTYLGLDCLSRMLMELGVAGQGVIVQRFTAKLEEMWKENGNRLSQLYAGTGALQGSKILDGARSAARTIQNNLLDSSKQEAIDILLHGNLLNNYLAALSKCLLPANFLHAPINVLRRMCERMPEFTVPIPLRVAVGTYNVNGGKHFRSLAYKHLSLDDWLLDTKRNMHTVGADLDSPTEDDNRPPDIFAIGFEEIVDLTASNIVQNTQYSENAASWGREMQKVISRDERFVMVTWAQLVGVALFVYVNERHANHVRDVSTEIVKTGMQGATGNKGGVGIRLIVRNTSIAFLCSHFAAGQKEVNERNNDYETIARKMIFPLGVPLWAHDYVFWCGDFNYRLSLPREEVMDLILKQDWQLLLEHDQLKLSHNEGKCFKGFVEGDINFPPTYKYDLFSDDYDTSEKCRVPAWTDRVLFWRRQYPRDQGNPLWSPGTIVHYGRAELKQSDHRPVLAVVEVDGWAVVERLVNETYEAVVAALGPSDCTVIVQYLNAPHGTDIDAGFSDDLLSMVQDELATLGSVVTVRFVDRQVWFTFRDSQMALQAVTLSPLKIGEHELEIRLKTERWREELEEELLLCGDSTVPLTDETVKVNENEDDLSNLRNIEGAMESFYQEVSGGDDEEIEDEILATEMPVNAASARPVPVRPAPARPPPPRPTPPNTAPNSPAMIRNQPITPVSPVKPARPTLPHLNSDPVWDDSFDDAPLPPQKVSPTMENQDNPEGVNGVLTQHDSFDAPPPGPPPQLFPCYSEPFTDTCPVAPMKPCPSAIPTRAPPSLPSRAAPPPMGPPPQIPARTLPPIPARNAPPPLPPRK